MSTLDDAYKVAAVAFSKSAEGPCGINHPYYKEHLEAAIPAFFAHLVDNPPDEMVEATASYVTPDGFGAGMEDMRRINARRALSAALRSIAPVPAGSGSSQEGTG